jgi:hypothetical protein
MTHRPKIRKIVVTTSGDLNATVYRSGFLGLILGVSASVLAYQNLAPATAAPTPIIDKRMEVACAWPTLEGEMTIVTIMDGKVRCWRWG